MASNTPKQLPPLAPFPEAEWRAHLVPEEWAACLDAWVALVEANLSLSPQHFTQALASDDHLAAFVTSYTKQLALLSPDVDSFGDVEKSKTLKKSVFFLINRVLDSEPPPEALLKWSFLADFAKAYGKGLSNKPLANLWRKSSEALALPLGNFKSHLTKDLEAGLKGKPAETEQTLKRLNHLLYASPDTAVFFMSGSDFLDALISCYKLMNPPLRNAIIATTYLCLITLTEGEKPRFSQLIDQLYSLQAAAEAHKAGPTNVNDSLVAELVTATPLLKQVRERIEQSGTGSARAKPIISSLEGFRKPNASRPKRIIKRKINKGKKTATTDHEQGHGAGPVNIHLISLVSQVQDLFPDLGSAFIVKLLDEYNEDVEVVISHLLEDSLPPHLNGLDRTEALPATASEESHIPHLSPRSTPPLVPTRRNIYDDDEFDQLAVSTSRLHFGRKDADKTADDILKDRSTAPNAAAILAALAAFDSDDDERDDTYDAADVGGAVDANNTDELRDQRPEADDAKDEVLFRAWKMNNAVFGRDAPTRRGKERASLKQETGMTDEAIEGWGIMLSRDPRRLRRLEAKMSSFGGQQNQLASTSWRADSGTEGTEGSDADGGNRGRGGFRGRGRGFGGRGRGGGSSVAGPPGQDTDKARERKDQNKGRVANHNRRDQRARKVARAGFPG
jgi:activating signal cointegrator complex subunit 2